MLPMTRAEAGSGVRRNGSAATAWLAVNGTSEPDQAGEVAHRAVEVAVAVLDRPDEVAEQLEADRPVDRAPGQQCSGAHGVVERGVVAAEHGHRLVAHQ